MEQHDRVALSDLHVCHLPVKDPPPLLLVRKCCRDHFASPFLLKIDWSNEELSALPSKNPIEEFANRSRYFLTMGFQGEMPRRIEVHLRPGIVPLERFRSSRQEKGIISAPHR